MKKDFESIAKEHFLSKETLDINVFPKLKEEGATFLDVLKALGSLGFNLRECQDLMHDSIYYHDNYNNAANFTEHNLDAIEKIANRLKK